MNQQTFEQLLGRVMEQRDQLLIERDALREALKGLLDLETRYTNVSLKEFDAARAALSKVGGEK